VNPELTDIGVNLLHPQFQTDRAEVIERARLAGVTRMLVTATNLDETEAAIELCENCGAGLWCTAGVHPHDAKAVGHGWQARLRQLVRHPKVKAVGETGLDFYRNFSPAERQIEVFRSQLEIAGEIGKPVFVHDRDSAGCVGELLNEHAGRLPGVVVHCFTGNRQDLLSYLDAGYHIGVTGWVCDKRRGEALRELVPLIPLERLLIESDAPFLRPHNAPQTEGRQQENPEATKRRNEPALLGYVVEQLAQLYGSGVDDIAEACSSNAARLFQLAD